MTSVLYSIWLQSRCEIENFSALYLSHSSLFSRLLNIPCPKYSILALNPSEIFWDLIKI
jgi:hypothetical protein